MKELKEIAQWLDSIEAVHPFVPSNSLPSPQFERNGQIYVSFSTNNYLALATDPLVVKAAKEGLDRYGIGNCESRLLGGDIDVYREVESQLSSLLSKEGTTLFGSGFLANIGALGSMVRGSQLARLYGYKPKQSYRYMYFSDELNHVSINEGIRLSGVERNTYRHCDLNHLEQQLQKHPDRSKVIVTDGVFSQDGDIVPLEGLLALAEKYDAAIFVDDAHGFGILGDSGAGVLDYFKIKSDRIIYMATLSKAIGVNGGFISADIATTEMLRLCSPAYGFTGSILPDQACAIVASLEILKSQPERRRQLWDNQRYFVKETRSMGYRLVSDQTPVVPILVGEEKLADQMASKLLSAGIYVDAVKFPAVGVRQARLRFIMNARHSKEQLNKVLEVLNSLKSSYVDPGTSDRKTTKKIQKDKVVLQSVKPGLQTSIFNEIARIAKEELTLSEEIKLNDELRSNLNIDSLGLIILAGNLEERFGVPMDTPEALDIETVSDIVLFIESHKKLESES